MSYLRQELDMKIGSTAPWRRGTIIEIAILVKMMAVDGGVLAEKLSLQAGLSSSKEHGHVHSQMLTWTMIFRI